MYNALNSDHTKNNVILQYSILNFMHLTECIKILRYKFVIKYTRMQIDVAMKGILFK